MFEELALHELDTGLVLAPHGSLSGVWLNLPPDQKKYLKFRTAELYIYSTAPLTCESNVEALEDGVNECWKLGQRVVRKGRITVNKP